MIAGTALDNDGRPIPALDFFAVNPIGTGPGQVSSAQFDTIFGSNIRNLGSSNESSMPNLSVSLLSYPAARLVSRSEVSSARKDLRSRIPQKYLSALSRLGSSTGNAISILFTLS